MAMMTDSQRQIFGQILDVNHDANEANKAGNVDLYLSNFKKLHDLLDVLKEDMGEAEFNKFMAMGKAMFAER